MSGLIGSDKSYHVVTANGVSELTALDGLIIENGHADSTDPSGNVGGGLYCISASPTLKNCTIRGNISVSDGGGIYLADSSPLLINCLLINNQTTSGGGGAIYNGQFSDLRLANCTLSKNIASTGNAGGIFQESGSLTVANSIIWGNDDSGDLNEFTQIYHLSGVVNLYNSCIEDGSPGDQIIPFSSKEDNNIDLDPKFVDPTADIFELQIASPCIDSGKDSLIWAMTEKDEGGNVRALDGDNDGQPEIDMGPFEYISQSTPYIYVSKEKLVFIANQYSPNPAVDSFEIRNLGTDTLDWTASVDPGSPWLEIVSSTTQGSLDTGSALISVRPDIAGLPPGNYTGTIKVESTNASINSPVDVTVELHIGGVFRVPTQYPIIQDAIDAAWDGDTVLVDPGFYQSIDFKGKNIIVTGTDPDDWSVTNGTQIFGGGSGPVVTFNGTETSECKLTGFFIFGGNNTQGSGGAICGESNGNKTNARISRCLLISNTSSYSGGAIYGVDGAISNCLVAGNSATLGGGISNCDGVISNCLIYNNSSTDAVALYDCDGNIINCTIADNSTTGGQQAAISDCDGGSITNCIVWGNTNDTLCDSQVTAGYNCIGTDPGFISGVYTLDADSPCRDSGTDTPPGGLPEKDLQGNERKIGIKVDLGAFEYIPNILYVST